MARWLIPTLVAVVLITSSSGFVWAEAPTTASPQVDQLEPGLAPSLGPDQKAEMRRLEEQIVALREKLAEQRVEAAEATSRSTMSYLENWGMTISLLLTLNGLILAAFTIFITVFGFRQVQQQLEVQVQRYVGTHMDTAIERAVGPRVEAQMGRYAEQEKLIALQLEGLAKAKQHYQDELRKIKSSAEKPNGQAHKGANKA